MSSPQLKEIPWYRSSTTGMCSLFYISCTLALSMTIGGMGIRGEWIIIVGSHGPPGSNGWEIPCHLSVNSVPNKNSTYHHMRDWHWTSGVIAIFSKWSWVARPLSNQRFGTRKLSKMWVNWYCPSSLFMVLPLLFLISIAYLIHLLYLSSSVP